MTQEGRAHKAETFTIVWSGTQEKAGFEALLRDWPELGG
jgi:hypothetical protein